MDGCAANFEKKPMKRVGSEPVIPIEPVPSTLVAAARLQDDDLPLCVCTGASRASICHAIRRGATSTQELGRQLGCGMDCGTCVPLLQDLLGQSPWFSVRASRRNLSLSEEDPRRIVELSFELQDGIFPPCFAGQHITVQIKLAGQWVSRCYTIINDVH